MKLMSATLAALVLVVSAPSARAEGAVSPAGEPSVFDLAWSALTSPTAVEGQPGRKRQPRRTPRADKETAANRAGSGGRVAASAQVVKAVPVAKATAAALPAPGRPAALDCRRYVPTAGMTISVACTD
ncbi:MAG TPA: hypothetical protein VNK52_07945 [Hyphomicrobiaceae bacterium]|nr:hypothetical protein [Hyphomicrobiaceae bacterium]